MGWLVELNEVSRVYDGGTRTVALDGVSFQVERGEFTSVMGPSGSGKSTLLNLVAGLDRPTSGRVAVDAQELTRASETDLARYRRSRVGFVFQFFNLLSNLTVLENVLVPAELAGVRPAEARERARTLLAKLEMANYECARSCITCNIRRRQEAGSGSENNPADPVSLTLRWERSLGLRRWLLLAFVARNAS